ncbi:hypothetical protein VTK73DRAFT_199 [Phialemonium thermophilum]|uniref:N-acetyltransferase domain-containing protein n=1 Tax=Phialemonium thermophilum TaxID=223376 RepID=A0ABR3XFQ1_9PEZI
MPTQQSEPSSGTTGPFALSRASVDDFDEITHVQYRSFESPYIRELFMGCRTEADIPRLVRHFAATAAADPSDIWVKVFEVATGRIVAASNWKVHPNAAAARTALREKPASWLQGEARARAEKAYEAIEEARRQANPEGYVHLHICFTDPEYRRRGAGALMMQWGCDLADQLFLPGWIEASPEGNHLYRRYGFYDLERAAGGLSGTNMRRDAARSLTYGGKES